MGSNSHGQLGIDEMPSSTGNKYSPILIEDLLDVDPYDVQCGSNHSLLLSRQGNVFSWGSNKHGQCGVHPSTGQLALESPTALNCQNVLQIDCGSEHSAFIDNSGRTFTFGSNKCGQLGIGNYNDEF